jgi:two-component system KDP operon response regulator KdpE
LWPVFVTTSRAASDPEPQILVIDDELSVRTVVRVKLEKHGYRVVEAETATAGLEQARACAPDAVVLDLGLPDMDGLDVTKAIRARSPMPILIVSARGREQDKVDALDAGADDYLTKPFGADELLARLRVALRHAARAACPDDTTVLRAGDLSVDLDRRTVLRAGHAVHLTPIQYTLLVELMKAGGRVVTHRQLLVAARGPAHVSDTQYLRVFMSQLRQKLEPNVARPEYIATDPGVGYRILVRDA